MSRRASTRKRAAVNISSDPVKTKNRRQTPFRNATSAVPKLKLVLSSSSSSSSSSSVSKETKEEEVSTDSSEDLILSGLEEDEEDEEDLDMDDDEEEDLQLQTSPAVVRGSPRAKLQLKLPKSTLNLTGSSSPEADTNDDENEEYLSDDLSDEDNEEVDLSKMTARQRARHSHSLLPDLHFSPLLPSTANSHHNIQSAAMTEEEVLKRAEKSRRRRIQQEEKLEEHKRATIQRLLQKQGARSKRMQVEQAQQDASVATMQASKMMDNRTSGNERCVRYVDRRDETHLVITDEDAYNLMFGKQSAPRKEEKCAAPGCNAPRKYTHAKLMRPVCSLQCYRAVE